MALRKIKYDFNPLRGLRGAKRTRAAAEIKQYVEEQVTAFMNAGNSPVSGQGKYKQLSKVYALKKKGGSRHPDLHLTGKLQASVTIEDSPRGALRLTVSPLEQKKADGHNNFTGKSTLPRRAFIPDVNRNERLKRQIELGINRIANRFKETNNAD